jgi:hypothetical protein
VGLITHKDCKHTLAQAFGIPAHRVGHFSRLHGRNSRAYYHADMLVIDGTCTGRMASGTWITQRRAHPLLS